MIGKILCAGVLAAALMLLPNPNSGEHVKNSETQAAVAKTAGQMRQQDLLTAEASTQRKMREPAPVMEKPVSEPETAVTVQTSVKASEPEPQKQGCEQYRHLFEQYNWPVNTALAICQAESSGNIQATNWGDNHGKCKGSFSLMQVGCFWYPHFGYSAADRYNPEVNVKIAYQIYERQKSFRAWTTYTGGRYLKFL